MLRATLLAGLALFGYATASTCTDADGFDIASSCICPSDKYWNGTACVPAACSSVPASEDISFTTAGMNLTAAEMDGTTTNVKLNLTVPMLQGREYKNFYILAPGATTLSASTTDGAPATCDQSQFTAVTAQTAGTSDDCRDKWQLQTIFNRLRGCGFTRQSDSTGATETYDGVIRVAFEDPVSVGSAEFLQNLTRSASIDFPFRVVFQSQYTFPIDTSDLKVVSNYKVDFAIVGQNVDTNPSAKPTVTIQYTIQYPWAITAFGTLTDTNSAMTPTINSAVQCTIAEYDYSATNRTASTCKHENIIEFTTTKNPLVPASCKFSGDQVKVPFTVGCAKNLPTADCPLTQGNESLTQNSVTGTNNSVTFTLTSENFCQNNGQSSNINGAVTLKSFQSVSQFGGVSQTGVYTNGTEQNAWRYGDYAFYEIQIDGLPVQTFQITKLVRTFDSATATLFDQTTANPPVANSLIKITGASAWADQQIGGTSSPTGVINDAALGVHTGQGVAGNIDGFQDYRFALLMDSDLLGTVLTPANRGEAHSLQLTATCDVSYETTKHDNISRRRRRQATTDSGTGTIQSNTASIAAPEEAAAVPSSAVRTGPVLALAVALLSAVVMA